MHVNAADRMPAPTPADQGANRILAVLFVGVLMGALDIAIVGPALPAMRAEFGADERAIAWVFTIYVLFNLIGTPLMAKLSDRLGRRLVYTLDVALFAAGSLVVATARSLDQVLVGRAVQAFGAGGIFPVASAVIGDALPPERRGRALGLIGAVFGIAFLLGPFVAAGLLRFGWEWLFIVNLPVAVALMVASWRILPGAAGRDDTPPFDWAGMLLLSVALGTLSLGLSNIDSHQLLQSLAEPRRLGAAARRRDRQLRHRVGRASRRRPRCCARRGSLRGRSAWSRCSPPAPGSARRAWCSCRTSRSARSACRRTTRATSCCRWCWRSRSAHPPSGACWTGSARSRSWLGALADTRRRRGGRGRTADDAHRAGGCRRAGRPRPLGAARVRRCATSSSPRWPPTSAPRHRA